MKERIRLGMEDKGARQLLGSQPHLELLLFGYQTSFPVSFRIRTKSRLVSTSRLWRELR
jgi:hypothetical protein